MGYLIKEATPAWAAHTTAKLLAKAGIVPTAAKYGSKVVKAYKNMQARGTLSQPFQVPTKEIGMQIGKDLPTTAPKTFNNVLEQFDTAAAPAASTRHGIAISRAPWRSPVATRVTNIRGANNEEYVRMLDPANLQRPVEIKVTGNPILDRLAWDRSISKALVNPEIAKRYKGRILDYFSLKALERNHPGISDSTFSRLRDNLTTGTNAAYIKRYKTVAVPERIATRLFDIRGGYNVAKKPFIRKAILDHENLGHAGMADLPITEANKASQRYYMAIKHLDNHLAKNAIGYKPLNIKNSNAWVEGTDQAHAARQSRAIRTADKRFFENVDSANPIIPRREIDALGSVTKQQVFGPNTNISDELFEAARSGLLQMRRNYRLTSV